MRAIILQRVPMSLILIATAHGLSRYVTAATRGHAEYGVAVPVLDYCSCTVNRGIVFVGDARAAM